MKISLFTVTASLVLATFLAGGCRVFQREAALPEPPVPELTDEELAEQVEAEQARQALERWLAFEIEPGMNRQDVEAALSRPAHTSRTKDGQLYVMYEEQAHWRSVVYNDLGQVVLSYP